MQVISMPPPKSGPVAVTQFNDTASVTWISGWPLFAAPPGAQAIHAVPGTWKIRVTCTNTGGGNWAVYTLESAGTGEHTAVNATTGVFEYTWTITSGYPYLRAYGNTGFAALVEVFTV